MDRIRLVIPEKVHEAAAMDYMREHFAAGEKALHGASLLEQQPSYDAWLDLNERCTHPDTAPPDWVTASIFFAIRDSDQRIVGIINIRHRLNDFLRQCGGHIGYGVRPSERRKGYAKEMLRLGLLHCKTIGLSKVMVACDQVNVASAQTIRACGGVLDREFLHEEDGLVQVYWIDLNAN